LLSSPRLTASPWPKLFRLAKWVVLPPLVAWLAYLLFANLYLNAQGLELTVAAAEDSAEVELGPAFTWWPGRVIARDLRVIVHDSHVEMDLRIDALHADVRLLSLFGREFETRSATVTGVSIRLRKTRPLIALCKVDPGLPPIDHLNLPAGEENAKCADQVDTSLTLVGPKTPAERLFRVRLGGLVVRDLREVWVERYRAIGWMQFDGSLRFWPTREVGLLASSLGLEDVDVEVGPTRQITGLDLEASGRIREIRFDRATSEEMWAAVSFHVKAAVGEAELALVEQVIASLRPIAPPRLPQVEGRAKLEVALVIEEGWTQSLSIHAAAMQASLRLLTRKLAGRAEVDLLLVPASRRSHVLTIERAKATLRNIEIRDGEERRQFADSEMEVSGTGTCRFSSTEQHVLIRLKARASKSAPLVELMPGGMEQTILDLLIHDDAPATVDAELFADQDVARFESITMIAGPLRVDGRMRLAPEPGGRLVIRYRDLTIHKDI
jgi:hypothetical protein